MMKSKPVLAGIFLASAIFAVHAEDKGQVLATVNGTKLTAEDMTVYMNSKPASERSGSPQEAVGELVDREVLYQEAVKQGLDKDDDFKKRMEARRVNLLVATLLEGKMEKIDMSDAALKKEYDAQIKSTDSTEYKARHILLKEEAAAKDVIKELDKKADFEKLAKEKSTGPSGPKGGDLGWFMAATMVPEFGEALKTMKKGEYSKKPVKTQFGWHVILLEDTRKREAPPFDKVKPQLKNILANKEISAFIDKLRSAAKVELSGAK